MTRNFKFFSDDTPCLRDSGRKVTAVLSGPLAVEDEDATRLSKLPQLLNNVTISRRLESLSKFFFPLFL